MPSDLPIHGRDKIALTARLPAPLRYSRFDHHGGNVEPVHVGYQLVVMSIVRTQDRNLFRNAQLHVTA